MSATTPHYSSTYTESRRRFLRAAEVVGATVSSYPLDGEGEELAIDVAVLGEGGAPTVVISSGVHGVEGFPGSAIQHAVIERVANSRSRDGVRFVLVHAVNPYGFARLRRFNEDNVDLNRNFLAEDQEYAGAPDGYDRLESFLNPRSAPSRFEPFRLKALWNIWRHGLQALKQAVAGGQYQYPHGVFFGGSGPCASTRIVREHCDSWFGGSRSIVHLDVHTGLGPYGVCKLLVSEPADSDRFSWFVDAFGPDRPEALDTSKGTAYRVQGLFGDWLRSHFADREYRFATAEFGTFGVIRILSAIRAENRAHHHCAEQDPIRRAAAAELRECFCPADSAWRSRVLETGLHLVERAAGAVAEDGDRRRFPNATRR